MRTGVVIVLVVLVVVMIEMAEIYSRSNKVY